MASLVQTYMDGTGTNARYPGQGRQLTQRHGDGMGWQHCMHRGWQHTGNSSAACTGVLFALRGDLILGPLLAPPLVAASSPGCPPPSFNTPSGMAFDASGTYVYVADSQNHVIRRITVATATVEPWAGEQAAGWDYQDGYGTKARFGYPMGITIHDITKVRHPPSPPRPMSARPRSMSARWVGPAPHCSAPSKLFTATRSCAQLLTVAAVSPMPSP